MADSAAQLPVGEPAGKIPDLILIGALQREAVVVADQRAVSGEETGGLLVHPRNPAVELHDFIPVRAQLGAVPALAQIDDLIIGTGEFRLQGMRRGAVRDGGFAVVEDHPVERVAVGRAVYFLYVAVVILHGAGKVLHQGALSAARTTFYYIRTPAVFLAFQLVKPRNKALRCVCAQEKPHKLDAFGHTVSSFREYSYFLVYDIPNGLFMIHCICFTAAGHPFRRRRHGLCRPHRAGV